MKRRKLSSTAHVSGEGSQPEATDGTELQAASSETLAGKKHKRVTTPHASASSLPAVDAVPAPSAAATAGATATELKQLEELILRLTQARAADGSGKTVCPSEIARAMSRNETKWRSLMPAVRAVAAALIDGGAPLRATQRGQTVQLGQQMGPIRLQWVG